jgi:hypothetical protein
MKVAAAGRPLEGRDPGQWPPVHPEAILLVMDSRGVDGGDAGWRACPTCGRSERLSPEFHSRYPDAVCQDCMAAAVDADGRPLQFSNESLSGGFLSYRLETSGHPSRTAAPVHVCYVHGRQCWADEAYLGGVVIVVTTFRDAHRARPCSAS